jgi:alpha-1,3-rhamnosyl/mannosyltransferase
VWLPLELKRYPVDVFLGFAQALPASQKSYNIGFIYDLGFFYRPDVYGQAAIALKRQTETLVRRANHIITISHASKEDILYEYDLQSSCVSVAYPGVDLIFSPAGNAYRAKRPYVLFVGSLNKAKDIPTLLTTVADTPYDVYLIGGDFWPDPAIDETIERLRIGDRVKKLGVVPDEELLKYYRGAIAVATTALREGFCLPAAEAMACGTPVVALDRGALREIVAEGGIIAKNTKEFRDALMRLGDKKIRAVFSKKAVVQAKQYRWETFAKHILTCIDSDIRHPGLDPGSSSK